MFLGGIVVAMVGGVQIVNNVHNYAIKASFKRACLHENKFKNAVCALPISVGQLAHEGDRFAATVSIIADTFKECIVMVNDSLQRYSISAHTDKSIAELHHQANVLGEQWIARNEEIISKLTTPHQIIRWDSWLHHPLFADAQEKINCLYSHDFVFKKIIDDGAEGFVKRDQKRSADIDYDYNNAFNNSVLYLKEECAVMLLWVAEDIDFEIYPRNRIPAMKYVYSKFVLPEYGETLLPLSIRFQESRDGVINNGCAA